MKTRTGLVLLFLLFLIALSGILFFTSLSNQETLQVFSASVNRDCAPWDGEAFTVKVSTLDGRELDLSMWQSPEIAVPTRFAFPDETQQVGNALLIPRSGMPEQLTGEVWFQSVSEGKPIEGRFSLTSERGEQFKGKFVAEWEGQRALCG
jgi:hypothetical protein